MGKERKHFYVTIVIILAAVFLLNNIANPSGKFIKNPSLLNEEDEEFLPLEEASPFILENEVDDIFQEEEILKRETIAQDEMIIKELLSDEMFAEIKELKKRGPLEALARRIEAL